MPGPPMDRYRRNTSLDENGCLIWRGSATPKGYGQFSVNGRNVYVHRWIYEQTHGPVPYWLQIDHLCRQPRCVRLDHLEAVTPLENSRRSNSPWAIKSRSTHCVNGHEWDEINTYIASNGVRKCRACNKIRQARYRKEDLNAP